ncbi:MAG TPA: DUF2267 domain-containing protein [Candidatus Binataceae bacterium]|nr:DUF2267 domain-containing protein [Candidatus Binataceae bacterium]
MDEGQFLHEVETLSGLTREQSFKVTTATLQELHDRLSPKEANDLAAQLPHEFKAMWHALDAPGRDVRRSHKEDFVRHIADVAEIGEIEANKALKAVFKALQTLLKSPTGQEGEAWDVFSQLPKDLKRVWLSVAAEGTTTSKAAHAGAATKK